MGARAASEANTHGVRLIITLVNNWDDYGGVSQYLAWCGSTGKPDFFKKPRCKNIYKRYIYRHQPGNSININAPRNGDDPTVFAWELMNEPRCSECGDKGATVKAWIKEMACFISQPALERDVDGALPARRRRRRRAVSVGRTELRRRMLTHVRTG